jgi:hypothetical protein
VHGKADVGRGDDHGGVQLDPQAVRIAQGRTGPVGAEAAFALDGEVAGHAERAAEQDQHLVDQVRAQIQPDAAARPLAPAVPDHRAAAVVAALDGDDAAQPIVGDHRLEGEEVGVPAAVLEDRQQQPL